jgi:hypothetical protein
LEALHAPPYTRQYANHRLLINGRRPVRRRGTGRDVEADTWPNQARPGSIARRDHTARAGCGDSATGQGRYRDAAGCGKGPGWCGEASKQDGMPAGAMRLALRTAWASERCGTGSELWLAVPAG